MPIAEQVKKCQLALDIQDASNILAVLNTLKELIKDDREMKDAPTILVLSKFASMIPYNLTCIGEVITPGEDPNRPATDNFRRAYETCKILSGVDNE